MTINEYQALALRTESRITTDPVPYIRVLEGLMGLNGEAGEAIDLMKKVLFQGHEFDREHMAKELGDIAWYLAVSADSHWLRPGEHPANECGQTQDAVSGRFQHGAEPASQRQ